MRLRLGPGDGRADGAHPPAVPAVPPLSPLARVCPPPRLTAHSGSAPGQHLPEGVFGNSWVQLTHEASGVKVRFDAEGALLK